MLDGHSKFLLRNCSLEEEEGCFLTQLILSDPFGVQDNLAKLACSWSQQAALATSSLYYHFQEVTSRY
jgi:hypothetical protein